MSDVKSLNRRSVVAPGAISIPAPAAPSVRDAIVSKAVSMLGTATFVPGNEKEFFGLGTKVVTVSLPRPRAITTPTLPWSSTGPSFDVLIAAGALVPNAKEDINMNSKFYIKRNGPSEMCNPPSITYAGPFTLAGLSKPTPTVVPERFQQIKLTLKAIDTALSARQAERDHLTRLMMVGLMTKEGYMATQADLAIIDVQIAALKKEKVRYEGLSKL